MIDQVTILSTPLAVALVALLVFIADLVLPGDGSGERRGLGALATVGLVLVLAFSFFWQPEGPAFGGAYVQDAYATYLQRILLVAGILGCLGSIDRADKTMGDRQGEYFFLMLSSLVGMLALCGARELVLLIVSFELMGLPLVALAALQKTAAKGVEAGLKLYLVSAVSSVVTLYGLSFIYGATGTTFLPAIAEQLAEHRVQPLFLALGMVLTLAGMGFKIGAVPFHMWVPDTYQGAPTPFVAFLSVAPKAAGFAALIRLFVGGLHSEWAHWWPIVMVVAVVTMVLGNLMAVPQDHLKRLLGYSGIAHIGLLLVAFGIASSQSLGVVLFYLLAYVFTNMGAFFVIDAVGGTEDMRAVRGLATRSPALAFAMLLFLLSLGGIPFVAGFWAKILLFWAVWQAGLGWIVILGASLAVLALFYYMRVARSLYIEKAEPDAPLITVARPMQLAIGLSVAGVVGLGLMPRPFIEAAMAAAGALVGG